MMSLDLAHQEKQVYPTTGDVNFDQLVEVVSARFLHCEVLFPYGH